MKRSLASTILIATLTCACGVGSGAASPDPPTTRADTTTTIEPAARDCLLPDETPYRSWWLESAEGPRGQVVREIAADQAHWVYTSPGDDAGFSSDPLSNIIIGDAVWTLDDGAWEEFPVVPIRWPLLVWVNGYVNGPGVAKYLVAGDREEVDGIPVTVYRGGVDEMTAAFAGKMAGREFVETGTSFAYWVDDCGALLRADVTIELGGEERETALEIDLPTVYRYQYLVYDVGTEFEIVPPVPGYLPEIPLPPNA